jgi:hypothetical protein
MTVHGRLHIFSLFEKSDNFRSTDQITRNVIVTSKFRLIFDIILEINACQEPLAILLHINLEIDPFLDHAPGLPE